MQMVGYRSHVGFLYLIIPKSDHHSVSPHNKNTLSGTQGHTVQHDTQYKGGGKRRHIVADTLLLMMFLGCGTQNICLYPCRANGETFVVDTKCF